MNICFLYFKHCWIIGRDGQFQAQVDMNVNMNNKHCHDHWAYHIGTRCANASSTTMCGDFGSFSGRIVVVIVEIAPVQQESIPISQFNYLNDSDFFEIWSLNHSFASYVFRVHGNGMFFMNLVTFKHSSMLFCTLFDTLPKNNNDHSYTFRHLDDVIWIEHFEKIAHLV